MQYTKDGRKQSDLWDPTLVVVFFRDAPANKCPRHLSKVQCSNALLTEFDAPGIWKFFAPGTTDGYCAVVRSTVTVIPQSSGSWPSGTGTAGFLMSSGQISLSKDHFPSGVFITWSQPTSPVVSGAELPNASSPVHLWWWSALLHCLFSACDGKGTLFRSAYRPPCQSRMFAGVLLWG